MCEFVSWIERKDTKPKVFFLTYDRIHNSPRGKAILKRFPGEGEPLGHAAIRAYYEFEGGKECECADFSDPKNFPTIIVRAIKRGEFRGLANPEGLLTAGPWKAYHEALAGAEKAYQEAKAGAEKAYQEAKAGPWKAYHEALAGAEKAYQEAKAGAEKAYQEAMAGPWKAYQEAMAGAEKAYQEAKAGVFWDLFADPNNRNPVWR